MGFAFFFLNFQVFFRNFSKITTLQFQFFPIHYSHDRGKKPEEKNDEP